MNQHSLDPGLASRLTERFSERVMDEGALPAARAEEIRESCKFSVFSDPPLLRLTCTITGSSHERPWDGSEAEATALVDEVAEDTAYLITKTPHYARLRSRH